jgi:hypothetical protein
MRYPIQYFLTVLLISLKAYAVTTTNPTEYLLYYSALKAASKVRIDGVLVNATWKDVYQIKGFFSYLKYH